MQTKRKEIPVSLSIEVMQENQTYRLLKPLPSNFLLSEKFKTLTVQYSELMTCQQQKDPSCKT